KWNLSRRNGIKEPVKNIVEKSDSSVWTVNVAVAPEVLLLRLPSTKPECCLLVCRALRGFLARISPQKNENGIPIKSTLDNSSTVQYAGLIHQLVMKARSTIRDIDPQNDLTFMRVRSKKNEIMIAPDKDFFLIVI
uniref:Dynein, light chain, roadblock-type 1 n=1 Tax=Haplochromis burtoni TaxID=8153 RepID=A0A3Q2VBR1_HAPBU